MELENKKKYYKSILDNFSWTKSVGQFSKVIEACQMAEQKDRIAIFCPSPVSYSAVGKYIFQNHAELSRLYDIDYYIEYGLTSHEPTRVNILEYASNYFPATSFDLNKVKNYAYILYNIGNSEFHTETILNALRLPGTAIIHDTKLSGVFDYMHNRGIITPERKQFEMLIDEVSKTKNTSCLTSIITYQKSLICHSFFAKNSVHLSGSPTITHAMLPVGVPVIELARSNVPTISFAGIISEEKGINLVSAVSELGDVKVKVFGYGVLGDSPLLNGLGSNVEVIKDLSDKDFQDNLRMSDIVVNYRISYQGETSLSTLEAMRYGAVVIVRRIGWFDELPDNTVMKVDSELELLESINMLIDNPEIRRNISSSARLFLKTHHTYGGYAKQIESSLKGSNL